MGAATSSNVANMVAQVTNSIISNASADNSNYQSCQNSQKFNNCSVQNLNIKNICNIQAKASSLVTQNNNGNLNSVVAQKLLQQAMSQVGSMGIGYASANNLVSALVNSSNSITNSLVSSSNNVMDIFNQFNCNNGQFGTINIVNDSTASWMTNQTVTQADVSSIISNVSQDISQSASATVQGLAGFLVALAVLIVAIGYVVFKPVGMLLNTKIIVVTFVFLALMAIVLFLYLKQLPPFFNPPSKCTMSSAISSCGPQVGCVDFSQAETDVTEPPLRYAFDIVGADGTIPGSDPNGKPGLLQMLIVANGGWTENAYNYFENSNMVKHDGFQNPLTQNGTYYYTNANGWMFEDDNRKLYARFVLCVALNIDTSVYIFDDESCLIDGAVVSPPDPDRGCLRYRPSIMPTPDIMDRALSGSGTITGSFGCCNNPSYRLQSFMKKGGFVIPIVIFIGLGAFLIFYNTRSDSSTPTATTKE